VRCQARSCEAMPYHVTIIHAHEFIKATASRLAFMSFEEAIDWLFTTSEVS
jgi:hypothetical protein